MRFIDHSLSAASRQSVACADGVIGLAHSSAAPRPSPPAPDDADAPRAAAGSGRGADERAALPQGFSVVLVLGDIQSVDDSRRRAAGRAQGARRHEGVPALQVLQVARRGVGDVLRPGSRSEQSGREPPGDAGGRSSVTQMLRGPEEREYELEALTSRTEELARLRQVHAVLAAARASEIAGRSDSGGDDARNSLARSPI